MEAALHLLNRDIFQRDEYKRSGTEWTSLIQAELSVDETRWFWQPAPHVGDVLYICSFGE
jgi:hypothetical protein